jgi:hypothetical protein
MLMSYEVDVARPEQAKRYDKAHRERIFLLEPSFDDSAGGGGGTATFAICGNTRNVYHVTLEHAGRHGTRVKCNCPDGLVNCKKSACVCKHACFVLFRVLRLSHEDVRSSPHAPMPAARRFALEQQNAGGSGQGGPAPAGIFDSAIAGAYRASLAGQGQGQDQGAPSAPGGRFAVGPTSRTDGAECAICFDSIDAGRAAECRACPDCRNVAHAVCIEKWLEFGRTTCVYCRSPSWGSYGKNGGAATGPRAAAGKPTGAFANYMNI